MLLKSVLNEIIYAQRNNLSLSDTGLKREVLQTIPDISSHALVVSGVRRCGKSTLLFQLLSGKFPEALYLNFEDPRLYEFEQSDFSRLDQIITDLKSKVLLFDEIRIIDGWEKYIRQKLEENFKIVITGSNASLLSRELGTKLTGRHITKELFPFSFKEFYAFNKLKPSANSILKYLETGGFPEYVKKGNDDILHYLFEDILIRDIAVRYGVRDVKTLQRLALYLVSNVGKLITANRLKSFFDVSATSTIMEYLSHLENSYLFHLVPKFSYSIRKQLVNPRKVYSIDTGLIHVNSSSFTTDSGNKFENLVFLHLRRRHKEIYYFSDKGECDFVVFDRGKIMEAVQVCFDLNQDNLDRELNGLIDSLKFFNLKQGAIVTLNQKDRFKKESLVVDVTPAHEYLVSGVRDPVSGK